MKQQRRYKGWLHFLANWVEVKPVLLVKEALNYTKQTQERQTNSTKDTWLNECYFLAGSVKWKIFAAKKCVTGSLTGT